MIDPYTLSDRILKAIGVEIETAKDQLAENRVNWENAERDYGYRCGIVFGLRLAATIVKEKVRGDSK